MPLFRRRRHPPAKSNPLRRLLRRTLLLLLLFGALDTLYLYWTWPDWEKLATGPIPKSSFIQAYEAAEKKPAPLRWQPVPYAQISPWMRRAVIVAEDSRFYSHEGVDLEAMREAIEYNWEQGRVVYGASTISQQTAKNLFLSPSRNPLRKWHELVLTWGMESNLKKRRILELYLNVAEFGPGIYGVEAAARRYWGINAVDLGFEEAIELAATLPSPKHDNPATRTRSFLQRKEKIRRHFQIAISAAPVAVPAPTPETGAETPTAPATDSAVEPEQADAEQHAVDDEGQHADALEQLEEKVDAEVGGDTGEQAAQQ